MTERDVNEMVARYTKEHRVDAIEGPNRIWCVVCYVCKELDPKHPNYGGDKTWPAPGGEEQAARIIIDHFSKLGYAPRIHPTLDGRIPRGQV